MIAAALLILAAPGEPAAPAPDTPVQSCVMVYGGHEPETGGPRSLAAQCPAGAPFPDRLQAAVDAALDVIPLGRWGRDRAFHLATEVLFRFDPEAARYHPEPRQVLISAYLDIPSALFEAERGFACAAATRIGPDGRPGEPDVYCLVEGERPRTITREAERAARDAVLATRYVPTGERYCETIEYTATIHRSDPAGYVDQLPDLCEEGE